LAEDKNEKKKICILLNALGPESLDIFNTFEVDDSKATLTEVLQQFEKYCIPKTNQVYERFKFFERKQKENEPVDAFVTDLKNLAKNCAFHLEERDKLVRDMLVFGTQDTNT
jgi:hypothetical protein